MVDLKNVQQTAIIILAIPHFPTFQARANTRFAPTIAACSHGLVGANLVFALLPMDENAKMRTAVITKKELTKRPVKFILYGKGDYVLVEYINEALKRAEYEIIDDE
ncbi:MAG: hypothetical protein GY940_19895, partial [bacterium]|nr:hypothetical protein [bacterium]